MDIRTGVLGPLTMTVDGTSVVPTAAKPRKVLALLAVRVGQVVPVPVILEELWGGHPPASALTTLQTYILQLRRLLDAALPAGVSAKRVLRTAFGGYQLDIDPDTTDTAAFERYGATGIRAMDLGDPETAERLLRQAAAVWRGPALVDVEIGPRLEADVRYLEERRMAMLERRIDADLAIGRHTELLSELAALTSEHRLNERLCEQYMRALHRCGRSVDALSAYRRIRRDLVGELALEPGPGLRELERAILGAAAVPTAARGRAQLVP
ncbi:BTAD domain-containing putative transcriptional regulator [Kitasatospora sp. NPDC048365]|uniref:AfsR/SARP family transcriptional regulator n=1 Tax=Kitasatospora sp. NPDC048365 TaxID=3364050 RepID=UPI00371D0825